MLSSFAVLKQIYIQAMISYEKNPTKLICIYDSRLMTANWNPRHHNINITHPRQKKGYITDGYLKSSIQDKVIGSLTTGCPSGSVLQTLQLER